MPEAPSAHTDTPTLSTDNQNRMSPFVVGVTGHRDLHPDALPQLRAALGQILRDLKERLPDSELRVMAGMASGADLLVVETALAAGLRVDAILPMPLAQYAADFDPESFAVMRGLLAHCAVRCVELPLSAEAEDAAIAAGILPRDIGYISLTDALSRGSNLLIALWDGESSVLPGGTADTVLRYLGVRTERNKDDTRLQFVDAKIDHEPSAQLVYWIPAARDRPGPVPAGPGPCFLAGLSDNALLRLSEMPSRLQVHLSSLNAYNREYRRFVNSWRSRAAPDSLIAGLGTPIEPADRRALELIDAQYGKADALALYFQKRSDELFTFFNLVAFAMGLAYVTYERLTGTRLLLFAYLVILTSSAVLYYVLHRRHWFAKHLMCRALAETLRVKFYLRLAGGERLVDAEEVLSLSGVNRFHGFGWIGHVMTAVESPPSAASGEHAALQQEAVDRAWIASQRQYFLRKVAQLHRSGVRTRWLQRILFGVIVVVVLVLLLLGEAANAHSVFGLSLERILTFIMGVMAVALASWELHQNKMAVRELLWQYRNQLKHFTRARAQLARTLAAGRRLEILAELGKDSLMESYLWTIHRFHREHEPPGRG
jgi:hypothetical protein